MTIDKTATEKVLAVRKIRDKTRNLRVENVAALRSFLWGLPGGMKISELLRVDFLGNDFDIRPETLVKTGNRLSMTVDSENLKGIKTNFKEQDVKK